MIKKIGLTQAEGLGNPELGVSKACVVRGIPGDEIPVGHWEQCYLPPCRHAAKQVCVV